MYIFSQSLEFRCRICTCPQNTAICLEKVRTLRCTLRIEHCSWRSPRSWRRHRSDKCTCWGLSRRRTPVCPFGSRKKYKTPFRPGDTAAPLPHRPSNTCIAVLVHIGHRTLMCRLKSPRVPPCHSRGKQGKYCLARMLLESISSKTRCHWSGKLFRQLQRQVDKRTLSSFRIGHPLLPLRRIAR